MLHSITTKSTKTETAVGLLIGCHDRIRHFTGMVRKLAHAEGEPEAQIASAAEAALRYFSLSLPLHEADEEESMRPRLLATRDVQVAAALDAMTHQHQAIDDLLERMMPLLTLLANHPAKLPETHAELCSLSKALDEVFRGHLDLEETVLFPALGPEMQDELLLEMQQRRKQG